MPDRQTAKKKSTQRSGKGPRPVAAVLPAVTRKALGKQGFAHAALITDWQEIVGVDLARVSQPERLSFQRGERRNGILHIRVLGAVATEMQHLAPIVMERVNRYFGFRAVAQLKLRHAATIRPARTPAPTRRDNRRPRDDTVRQLSPILAGIEDRELEEILLSLGQGVLGRDAPTGRK